MKEVKKQTDIISKYFVNGLKPAQIAKQQRVSVDYVYTVVHQFKKKAIKQLDDDNYENKKLSSSKKKLLGFDDPILHELTKNYIEETGIYKTKIRHLKEYIQNKLDDGIRAPSNSTLSKILREVFHQYYRKDTAANSKYRDTIYNSKRVWISRIIPQLLYDQVLVISMDESNIRTDALGGKQWQFNPNVKDPKQMTRTDQLKYLKRKLNVFNADSNNINDKDQQEMR